MSEIIGYVRNLNPLQIRNLPCEPSTIDLPNMMITEHEVHPKSAPIIKGEPIYLDWITLDGRIKKPEGMYCG